MLIASHCSYYVKGWTQRAAAASGKRQIGSIVYMVTPENQTPPFPSVRGASPEICIGAAADDASRWRNHSVYSYPYILHLEYIYFALLNFSIYQLIFDAADANKDGLISLEEYSYAIMNFFFHSDPDDPLSLYFGNLVDLRK